MSQPGTWEMVKALINGPGGRPGLTNRQVCETLDISFLDACHLTRMLHAAGEIERHTHRVGTIAYVYFAKGQKR